MWRTLQPGMSFASKVYKRKYFMASDSHAEYVKRLLAAVLTSDGDTDPSIRLAVEALSAQIGGRSTIEAGSISPELVSYIKKIALHAYKTTDEDIDSLRNAGYSEDAIFEITLSAALGAGMARLERGLSALKDDNQ
jgi:alkylhydroperoxidase family enzyme